MSHDPEKEAFENHQHQIRRGRVALRAGELSDDEVKAIERAAPPTEAYAFNDEERPKLRELLERRRKGPFISLTEMDKRIKAMVERKRREFGL